MSFNLDIESREANIPFNSLRCGFSINLAAAWPLFVGRCTSVGMQIVEILPRLLCRTLANNVAGWPSVGLSGNENSDTLSHAPET